jgi:quinoprotein glucose dehydrogenase
MGVAPFRFAAGSRCTGRHRKLRAGRARALGSRRCDVAAGRSRRAYWPAMPPARRLLPALLVLAAAAGAQISEPPYEPFIEPASAEAAAHLPLIRLAPGLSVSLWAAEPRLANPVCLALDEQGDVYVGESFRIHVGVLDIRDRMDWLDDDLACETVADRVAMFQKWMGDEFAAASREHDRIRLLRDTDGDGVADEDVVFADDFALPETGIGSGLLARHPPGGAREVFYTNIPDLWRLQDADADGRADAQASLSTGWGVRVAFMGHDMHGLRIGPDGRLYWSIGDRGFSVRTAEGELLHYPFTGAVLRCELDGSRLEVVHSGLRNPQELAFDERGNLFTGDNNCDAGDQARLVPIVQGGDSGWRQPGQWLDDRGPWGREKLWAPRFDGQAAWIIPPIANLTSGPSGLTHEPGTALPCVANQFLLCDFTGGADSSHIWAFPFLDEGAFYKLGEVTDLLGGVLATDADFGPDGALYVADWVEGWSGASKGRIWRVTDPAQQERPIVAETRELLSGDWSAREVGALEHLLAHPDQRVRTEAHFELAGRGRPGWEALRRAAHRRGGGLQRLHGIWGLGFAGRRDADAYAALSGLWRDEDPEVRAQLMAVLEPAPSGGATSWFGAALLEGLADESPRVVAQAALAAARLGLPTVGGQLLAQAQEPCGDPVLRHALAMGLAACVPPADLAAQAISPEEPRRLHSLLALRQLRDPRLADFLGDASLSVAVEAARAIHDLPVPNALPALAARIATLPAAGEDAGLPAAKEGGPTPHDDTDSYVRRVLNANDRMGEPANARALAAFAARADQRSAHRRFALEMLAEWAQSARRDRVLGNARLVRERDVTELADLARELRAAGLDAADDELAIGWVRVVAAADAADLAPAVTAILDDPARGLDLRVESLRALTGLVPPDLAAVVDRTLGAPEARLRAEALVALEQLSPELAVPRAIPLLDTGELPERRAAYGILGRAGPGPADERLDLELTRMGAELVPVELRLDVLLAAEARGGALAGRVAARRAARMAALFDAEGTNASVGAGYVVPFDEEAPPIIGMAVEPFLDTLFGGDRDAGRKVFARPALSCTKCHATDEWGRQVAGPNLQGVGRRLARLQLLESIVAPNSRISPGFGSELIFLKDGESFACRVLEEQDGLLKIADKDGRLRLLDSAEIELRKPSLSPMPEGIAAGLTREEMRDLLEFLAGL